MKEKRLLDPIDAVIEFLFTKEILGILESEDLKSPAINPYNYTKDLIDHVQTF